MGLKTIRILMKLRVASSIQTKMYPLYTIMSVQDDTSRCLKPPVDSKTKVPLWPGLAKPKWNFVLKSTRGFKQCDLSPSIEKLV